MNNAFLKIHKALLEKGLKELHVPRTLRKKVSYSDTMSFEGESIELEIFFQSTSPPSIPYINVTKWPAQRPEKLPHVFDKFICYQESKFMTLDRAKPEATVLWCIEKAKSDIRKALRGETNNDFIDELNLYWQPKDYAYWDIDLAFIKANKTANLFTINEEEHIFLISDKEAEVISTQYPFWEPIYSRENPIFIINCPKQFDFPDNIIFPPNNLFELCEWLRATNPEALVDLRNAWKYSLNDKKNPTLFWVLIRHKGTILAGSLHPNVLTTSFSSNEKYSRTMMAKNRAKKVTMTRYAFTSIHSKDWIARNTPITDKNSALGFSSKHIYLYGCGSVGGYIADLLVKSGAGFQGGSLTLSDMDTLEVGNIGRHILGFPSLGRRKTIALKEHLEKMYPSVDIKIDINPTSIKNKHDKTALIFDATGSTNLSYDLNEEKMTGALKAPVIYSWIEGNGIGVQSFLIETKKDACLYCQLGRIRNSELSTVPNNLSTIAHNPSQSCDDWSIPFLAHAPIVSAGLALNIATTLLSGKKCKKLQSVTFSNEGRIVKPTNPKKLAGCPICSQTSGN